MIDIHSHILPGLDDGARSMEEAAGMLEIAAATGTTDMVATPHSDLQYAFDPERIAVRLAELREAAGSRIRIYTGCDFHLTPENIEDALAHPSRYTINQKSYLLVELSEALIPRSAVDIFDRLRRAGMVPVITHPERNPHLQKDWDRLQAWAGHGCLVQVTAHAFLGRFGRRAEDSAAEMLRRGLVHFAASDAHDTRHRPPALDEPYAHVARHYGEACARALFVDNPKAALEGRPLEAAACAPQRHRWWRPF